jgi:hypothetical protein
MAASGQGGHSFTLSSLRDRCRFGESRLAANGEMAADGNACHALTDWASAPLALQYNCVKIQRNGDRGQDMDLRDALIDWDEPEDEGSNTAHVAEHGLTPEEVDSALLDDNTTFDVSDSSGRPIAFGKTATGHHPADHCLRCPRADGVKT